MTKMHLLAKSAILLLAFWAIAYTLENTTAHRTSGTNLIIAFSTGLIILILAAIALYKADYLAARLVGQTDSPVLQISPVKTAAFFTLAAVFAGIFATINSLVFARFIFEYYAGTRFDLTLDLLDMLRLLGLAWGIYLLTGAPHIINWQLRLSQEKNLKG